MTEEAEIRVSGRQVLLDAVTLAKDTGAFLYDLGRRVFCAIKTALNKSETEDPSAK